MQITDVAEPTYRGLRVSKVDDRFTQPMLEGGLGLLVYVRGAVPALNAKLGRDGGFLVSTLFIHEGTQSWAADVRFCGGRAVGIRKAPSDQWVCEFMLGGEAFASGMGEAIEDAFAAMLVDLGDEVRGLMGVAGLETA